MKKKLVKKEITLDDIARSIDALSGGLSKTNKKVDALSESLLETNKTVDSLAIMVAQGFERIDERFNKVEKRLDDVEEISKATRRDVLNLGERFVSRYEFDTLSVRVNKLESKTKNKTGK